MQEISRYTDYLKSEPAGIYFFSIRLSNAESLYTVLCKPEQGATWEISCIKFEQRYRKEYTFGFAFENQIPYPIENFFKPLDYNTIAEFLGDDAAKAAHFKEAYPNTQLDADIFSNTNISFADNVWDKLKEMFPLFNIPEKERQTPLNLISSIVRQLHASLHKDILVIPNNDLEGFNSYLAKDFIKNLKVNLELDQLLYLDNDLAKAISSSESTSIKLNRLKNLSLDNAILLSKNTGSLYLDALKEINAETLKALTSHNLSYISLRGLKDIKPEITAIIKSSKTFISLREQNRSNDLEKPKYPKEIIDASVASDKQKFNNLRQLIFSEDKENIDSGISLLSALNDPYAIDILLKKIHLEQEGRYTKINTEEITIDTSIDQRTVNYIVTSLLYIAGPESALAEQIKNKITALQIELFDLSYLHCFPGLEKLKIIDKHRNLTHLNDLQTLLLRELDISDCTAISDISRLAYFPIEVFRFKNCRRISSFASLRGKTDASNTKELSLSGFKQLDNLIGIEFFQSLEQLNIDECENLKDISSLNKIARFSHVQGMEQIGVDDFINLPLCTAIPSLFRKENQSICLKIGNWNSISGMGSFITTSINITCSGMLNLDWLEGFPYLEKLKVNCSELCNVQGLRHLKKLKELHISNTSITDLRGIENLEALELVNIRSCHSLKKVDEIEFILNLKTFEITDCKQLNSIEGWTKNKEIQKKTSRISFYDLPALIKIGDLSEFYHLSIIDFYRSFNEIVLNELKTCVSLDEVIIWEKDLKITLNTEVHFKINLNACGSFDIKNLRFNELIISKMDCKDLSFINSLERTKTIELTGLNVLESLQGIHKLSGIEKLSINNCKALANIESIKSLSNLKKISLNKLPSLCNISALGGLPSLESLEIDNCIAIDVKSRARGETELEKAIKYQIKILEFYKLDRKQQVIKLKNIQENPIVETPENNIQKLIDLLLSDNLEAIDSAIAILGGLRDEKAMNTLLKGAAYKNGELIKGNFISQCKNEYTDYILTGLLQCASFIDEWRNLTLRVIDLETYTFDNRYLNQFINLQSLKIVRFKQFSIPLELKQLKSLTLSPSYSDRTNLNFDLLSKCTNLESIDAKGVSIVNGLSGLKNLNKLKKICIESILPNAAVKKDLSELANLINLEELYISKSEHINSLNGIENCKKIERIDLSWLSISDTRPLKNLYNLKSLVIHRCPIESLELADKVNKLTHLDISSNENLNHMSESEFPEVMEFLSINNTAFKHFPTLKGVKKLIHFNCISCRQLKDFHSLKDIDTSANRKIDLAGCKEVEDINAIINHNSSELILSVNNIPKNIKTNTLDRIFFDTLSDLNGIEQFPNITYLNLRNTDITSSLPLLDLHHIIQLVLYSCSELTSIEGLENSKKLEVLDIRSTCCLIDISALNEIYPNKIYIHGSLLKKNDFPAHLQEAIDWHERY